MMIPVRTYENQAIAVFGLGRSGCSAARALMAGGAHVAAWDDSEQARITALQAGLPVEDINCLDWGGFKALVLSPGTPLHYPKPHRFVDIAQSVGLEIIGDMELFARARAEIPSENRANLVAVTGSNGKSTTTALIGHILKTAGRHAETGGNLGIPVLDLDPLHASGVHVLELSSFQLDLTGSFRPDIAVWLNISPDHLDRHGDIQGYINAKKRIFACQGGADFAIMGVDDPYSQRLYTEFMAQGRIQLVPISSSRVLGRGVYVLEGALYDAMGETPKPPLSLKEAHGLQGQHNWQNASAAYAVARLLDVPVKVIAKAFASFRGLPHRLEEVECFEGVRFINDSKASNPAATAQALSTYDHVFWIAGGRAKDRDFSALEPYLNRIHKAWLIGEAAPSLKRFLQGKTPSITSVTLEKAVMQAARQALKEKRKSCVVLLSPACASFDQFKNFEARGDAFHEAVRAFIKKKNIDKKECKEKKETVA